MMDHIYGAPFAPHARHGGTRSQVLSLSEKTAPSRLLTLATRSRKASAHHDKRLEEIW